MWPPPLKGHQSPSYASLFSRSAFSQRPLLSGKDFAAECEKRRLATWQELNEEKLEDLDSKGLLCPVAFARGPYEQRWLDPSADLMDWREEAEFRSWEGYAWSQGLPWSKRDVVSEMYSPWQLLYAADALKTNLHPQLRLDEDWRPLAKLLAALQPVFWPHRVKVVYGLYTDTGTGLEKINPMLLEAERFDGLTVLEEFRITEDDIVRTHAGLCGAAMSIDPCPEWYRLSELSPRKHTDLFLGDALRARDLRDASYLLRELYYWLTNEWLPLADEMEPTKEDRGPQGFVKAGSYDNRYYPRYGGKEEMKHSELKTVLDKLDLYPHRIHFFVEGESEEIVIDHILDMTGEKKGCKIRDLHGNGNVRREELLIAAASDYAVRAVLVADKEGDLAKDLKKLQGKGYFTDPRDVLLWELGGEPSSFEEANFRPQEIIDAIQEAAHTRDSSVQLALTADSLMERFQEAVEEAKKERKPRPALGTLALDLAEKEHIRVSKPELAQALTHQLDNIINEAGGYYLAITPQRPLLRRLVELLHGAKFVE